MNINIIKNLYCVLVLLLASSISELVLKKTMCSKKQLQKTRASKSSVHYYYYYYYYNISINICLIRTITITITITNNIIGYIIRTKAKEHSL